MHRPLSDSSIADVLNAVAALLWVVLAGIALALVGRAILRSGSLRKLSIGPTGVSFDFADQRIQEALHNADAVTRAQVGDAARRTVIDRLQQQADRLRNARILWVDDHPENNASVVALLREYGATVDLPRTNKAAIELLSATNYDVIISDVARDDEGPNSSMMGVEFARDVFGRFNKQILLFTARFDPATVPGLTDAERLLLVREVSRTVFGSSKRTDEQLHLILDILERE